MRKEYGQALSQLERETPLEAPASSQAATKAQGRAHPCSPAAGPGLTRLHCVRVCVHGCVQARLGTICLDAALELGGLRVPGISSQLQADGQQCGRGRHGHGAYPQNTRSRTGGAPRAARWPSGCRHRPHIFPGSVPSSTSTGGGCPGPACGRPGSTGAPACRDPLLSTVLSACLAGAGPGRPVHHGWRAPSCGSRSPPEQNYLANIPGLPDS